MKNSLNKKPEELIRTCLVEMSPLLRQALSPEDVPLTLCRMHVMTDYRILAKPKRILPGHN